MDPAQENHTLEDSEASIPEATEASKEEEVKDEKLNVEVHNASKRTSALSSSTLQDSTTDEKRTSFPKLKFLRHKDKNSIPKDERFDFSQQQQNDPLAHLPEHERETLRRQLDTAPIKATVRTLYRYATRNDLIVILISSICAIVGY